MRRHGPVIAHCTDLENFPKASLCRGFRGGAGTGVSSSLNLYRLVSNVDFETELGY